MTKQLIGLVRVSTNRQRDSGGGIEAQIAAIKSFVASGDYELLDIVHETASGGDELKDRPVLSQVLSDARRSGAMIVVNKIDRLTRNVGVCASLMNSKLKFCITELGGEEVDPLVVNIMVAVAENERKMISNRTKAALQAIKARGVKLGNPREWDQPMPDGTIKLGYRSAAKIAGAANASKADEFALRMKPSIERMLAYGMSRTSIAKELNLTNTKTQNGGMWHTTTVCSLIKRWEAI